MSGREHALRLMKQREDLELEIESTRKQLESHKVGRSEPLVTPDGFPRHDIDVATIRQLRVELIRKENDMKALLEEIATSLKSAFPAKSQSRPNTDNTPRPFCEVRSVVSNSLGDQAGIEAGDQIVKFGRTSQMSQLSLELKEHVNNGEPLKIIAWRPTKQETKEFTVHVTKERSLGCHIVPK